MPAVDERRFGKHGSDMPRTVIGVMSAVFGTAEQFQARRDLPTWAVHLSRCDGRWVGSALVSAVDWKDRRPA